MHPVALPLDEELRATIGAVLRQQAWRVMETWIEMGEGAECRA